MSVSSLPGHYHSGPGSFSPGFADNVIYEESLSDSLGFTDVIAPKAVFPRNLTDTLTLTEVIVDSDNFPQTLTLSESFDHYLSPLLSVHDVLTFNESFESTGVFVNNVSHVLALSQSIDHTKLLPRMVLTSIYSSIVLPPPIFGDSEALMDTLIFKRSMNGTKYTYCNRNNQELLNYTWQLTKRKADEFQIFLLRNDTQEITLTDWKGGKWKVIIPINNYVFKPVSRFDNSHEQVEVSCDFEGVRLV